MKDLIKRLFEDRAKTIELILLDDTRPGQDDTYKLQPRNLFIGFGLVLFLSVAFFISLMIFTPLGALFYNPDEAAIRRQLQDIGDRIIALQDSLEVRDNQLREIKTVIRLNQDTTLALDQNIDADLLEQSSMNSRQISSISLGTALDQFESGDFLIPNIFENAPEFPSRYPVEGTTTRGFEMQQGHFGIDIATKEDELILNVADGTVIASDWTMNSGYQISVQHSDGLITTYKHCSKLLKQEGEKVLQGDILGLIGDTGTSSSGPHLHFEIWKNGVPQNPLLYLIQ